MDKLILRCGRYYPPAQNDHVSHLGRLEGYVAALSAEAVTLFETCERLRREMDVRVATLEEQVAALSAPESAVAASVAETDDPKDGVSDTPPDDV